MKRTLWLLLSAITILATTPPVQAAELPFQIDDSNPRVIRNFPLQLQAIAQDPRFYQQWYLSRLNVPTAWDVTTGSNVIVAVVDTGIIATHEDLANKLWVNSDEIPGNRLDDDNNGYIDDVNGFNFVDNSSDLTDLYGHGTGTASLIAASTNNGKGIAGISWHATIMPLKALNNSGGGDYEDVATAIRYAVDNGARVINMSFGAQVSTPILDSALEYAFSKNAIIVAAVGNAGSNQVYYPAAYPGVIAVGSTNSQNTRSSFSNYGTGIDVMAPGEGIVMAGNSSNNTYFEASGTSFASAEVAGVAALVLARVPNISGSQMQDVLRSSADSLGDTNIYGAGLTNAYKAVSSQTVQLQAQATITNNRAVADGVATVNVALRVTDQTNAAYGGQNISAKVSGANNIVAGTLLSLDTATPVGTTDSAGNLNFTLASNIPENKTITFYQANSPIGSTTVTFITVPSPRYTMAWLGQSSYPSLNINEVSGAWLEVRNTGNIAWVSDPILSNARGQIYLGTDRPLDRTSGMRDSTWLSANRAGRMVPSVVRPGEIARFNFNFRPSSGGQFREYFRPVVEHVSWLNDLGIYWDVNVTGSGGVSTNPVAYSAQLNSQSQTLILNRGQSGTLTVTVTNNGSSTWSVGQTNGEVKIGTAGPRDRTSVFKSSSWLSSNRVMSVPTNVPPGGSASLTFSVTAPNTPGNYAETFQLVSEYITWFGPTFSWTLKVI